MWKPRRLRYVEEAIFNSVPQVTVYVDTTITLPPSIHNVYQGEFVLRVTNYHEYNTEHVFVV